MLPDALEAFYRSEAHAVQGPYLVIGLVVLCWAALVLVTRFPDVATDSTSEGAGSWRDYQCLLVDRRFMFGVIAQFFYVGAQVCLWSFTIRYGQQALPGTSEKTLANYILVSLVAFTLGRFVATALMLRIRPATLMLIYAGINLTLCAVAITCPNRAGLYALVATSFFMSLMFPTIFALSIAGLGERAKAGSSLLIMSIIGGAALTALMGYVSDLTSIHTAVIVPFVCFAVIAAYARVAARPGLQ